MLAKSRSGSYGSTDGLRTLRGHSPSIALHIPEEDMLVSCTSENTVLLQRSHSGDVVNSNFSSVIFNTATALLGASMFSLPWAFQQAGVIGGSVVLLVVAFIAGETALMLLMAQRAIFERTGKVLRYPEIAEEVLGHVNWAHFVRTATIISCIGGCCGYLIFLGQVSEQLLSLSYESAVYGLLLPLILVSWIRSFEELSFFTIIGVFAIVCSVIAILYGGYIQDDPQLFDFSDVVLFEPGAAFQFIGVVTFTFTIHYCVLSMGEEVLHNTQHIPSATPASTLSTGGLTRPLVIAYTASSLCIIFLGVAGYVFYRHSVLIRNINGDILPGCNEHVCQNVILNISKGWIRNFVGVALIISLGLSYIVILVPAREHIERLLLSWIGEAALPLGSSPRLMFENIIRAVLVLFTSLVALEMPYFGSVLGTVGGFTDATISFVLPPLIFLKLNQNSQNISKTWRVFNVVVFLFGAILVVKTTYTIVQMFVGMM